jgi:uncharacterized protein YegJ (DUF2314 family)
MSSPVLWTDGEDAGMIEAYAAARATFKYFWRELYWERRRIIPVFDTTIIKLPFRDGDDPPTEHMWADEVGFDGDILSGKLINSPNSLESLSEGDAVTAPFARLNDWMFVLHDKVYGGHTVNHLRSQMDDFDRLAHDKAAGWDFGDPAEVRLEIQDDPEVKAKRPKLFSRLHAAKTTQTGNATPEGHREHPCGVNILPKVEANLKEDAQAYFEPDEHGWTMLHHEALAGNLGIVKLLIQHGADATARTDKGKTAADLAAGIGWPEIAAFLHAA